MSLRGVIRVVSRTARHIERDQQSRARVAAQQYKLLQKQQTILDAAQAVREYEAYLRVLKTVHCDCSDAIDWLTIQQETPPSVPVATDELEEIAKGQLTAYQPSFWDRVFKLGPKKLDRLEQEILNARYQDEQRFKERQAEYKDQQNEWQKWQELSQQVLRKESDVYRQVMDEFSPFEHIAQLGSRLEFTFTSDHIEVDVQVDSADVIPDFTVSQLASGKLSRKALPISKSNEMYQDYVCSCLLRIAREVQAHLPISQVVVHAITESLNTATGLLENQVILSVAMPRDTLEQMNFTAIDPSDALSNFNHTMKFTRTGGFKPVDRVGIAAPIPRPKRS